MMHPEQQYLDILKDIMENGVEREDRTGIGTRSVFGRQMRFSLEDSFPLFTTKKTWFKGVVHELIWLLSGNTNIKYLLDNDVHIWDAWADKDGKLGPVYGHQWRNWENWNNDSDQYDRTYTPIDQIATVIQSIKSKPNDRGHIVSAWNVGDLDEMALRPCHTMFQFYVANGKLSCQLYQRSADFMLGVPFNTASYSLLTMMVAQVCSLELGEFIHTFGDAHVYKNHFAGAQEQLKRDPMDFPKVELNKYITSINDFKYEDVKLIDYKSHPGIKLEVAV